MNTFSEVLYKAIEFIKDTILLAPVYGDSLDNQFNQLYVVDLAFNVIRMFVAVLKKPLTHF